MIKVTAPTAAAVGLSVDDRFGGLIEPTDKSSTSENQQLDLFRIALPPCGRLGCPRYAEDCDGRMQCPACGGYDPANRFRNSIMEDISK
jgi:hypothetical protein